MKALGPLKSTPSVPFHTKCERMVFLFTFSKKSSNNINHLITISQFYLRSETLSFDLIFLPLRMRSVNQLKKESNRSPFK